MELIKNAVIESVSLNNGDYGVLTAWLHLSYGGAGQGFGGYCLYTPTGFKANEKQGAHAGHFINRCLEIAGVDDWAKLVGKTIRVKADQGKVHAIGHIIKEDWFYPTSDFNAINKALGL